MLMRYVNYPIDWLEHNKETEKINTNKYIVSMK